MQLLLRPLRLRVCLGRWKTAQMLRIAFLRLRLRVAVDPGRVSPCHLDRVELLRVHLLARVLAHLNVHDCVGTSLPAVQIPVANRLRGGLLLFLELVQGHLSLLDCLLDRARHLGVFRLHGLSGLAVLRVGREVLGVQTAGSVLARRSLVLVLLLLQKVQGIEYLAGLRVVGQHLDVPVRAGLGLPGVGLRRTSSALGGGCALFHRFIRVEVVAILVSAAPLRLIRAPTILVHVRLGLSLLLAYDVVGKHDDPVLFRRLAARVGLQLGHVFRHLRGWCGLLRGVPNPGCIHHSLRELLAALLELLSRLLDRVGQGCAQGGE